MARFVVGFALGDFGLISNFANPNALSPVEQTTTVDRYEDPEGDGFAFLGTGFTYAGLIPLGGTITAVDVYNAAGDPLLTITGLSASLAQTYQILSLAGLEAAFFLLTSGNDTFVGSQNRDFLESGLGNDTIRGNGGADILHGSKGRDVMFGGAGPDDFVFARGDGRDRIRDFQDTNLPSDDQIVLTRTMYFSMTRTQTLTGVELDFGTRGTLIVDGWQLAEINRGDFILT